jgi:hypothetical protein
MQKRQLHENYEILPRQKELSPKADCIFLTARLTTKLWNKLVSKLQMKLSSYYFDKGIYLRVSMCILVEVDEKNYQNICKNNF